MRGLKLKLLIVCALVLFVGAPVALGDWYPDDGHKMHFPQMPDPFGWDVGFVDTMMMIPLELADDWQCSQTGPVEDIHFWISWYYDMEDVIGPTMVSIYSNDPCGANGYSEPDELLWQQMFVGLDGIYYGDGLQGWYDPSMGMYEPDNHLGIYQINITDIAEPFIQEEGQIYWLGIQTDTEYVGWKTSLDHFEDNAVWRSGSPWFELNDPGTGGQLDFAFVITGEPEPEPDIKWEQPPDPCLCGLHAHHENLGFGDKRIIIADDWMCEGGVVTDLHWWGAVEDPGSGLGGFQLSIHDNDDPCCLPLDPALWEADIPIGSITVTPTGIFNNCQEEIIEYEYILPQQDYFYQVQGDTYWFDVCALSNDPCFPYVWTWQEAGRSTMPILCTAAEKIEPGQPWQSIVWPYDPCEYSDMAFAITSGEEPEPPKEPVPNLKWSQPPIEIDPTLEEPIYCGWDQESYTYDPNNWWLMAADDFRCLGNMPVTSVHWWGSYIEWDGPEPPPMDPRIIAWRIGFWSNVPAGADPTGLVDWSYPKDLLWQIDVDAGRVSEERVGMDQAPWPEPWPETCFQYYADLEPEEYFWQGDFEPNTVDDVFWLSISAVYPEDTPFEYEWGWKTRPWHWMDDGVSFYLDEGMEPGTTELDPEDTLMSPLEDWWTGESYDLAFELDTDPNWIKWDQPYTGIRHWPHYEDVASWMEWWPQGPAHLTVAADDWQCQGPLPVTALGWWGSYLGYQYQPCSVDPDKQPPGSPEQPAYFDVSIWTDVPADPCDQIMPWSHPDEPVWQYDVYDYDEVLVGYDKHPHDPCGPIPGPHEPVFRYTARIPEEEWFWQDPNEDTVYWLSIVAVYLDHNPQYEWGWTNHQHVYNDDAVQTPAMTDPDPGMPWQWNEIHDQTGASADLSFTIYTDPYAEREIDFGDAPDPNYPTLLANDGARHVIGGPWFGDPCIVGDDFPDPETDGQPDPCALGDDNDAQGDDEDGVSMGPLVQGIGGNISFGVSGADPCGSDVEFLIDFNGDGDWNDPCEHWAFPGGLTNGNYTFAFPAPLNCSVVGKTFTRWRIHNQGAWALGATGLAPEGEVEDHEVIIEPGLDFGDAPDPCYPTLLASNGARHTIVPGFCLGFSIDAELNGQPDATATGDDNDGNDDEDGVVFTSPLVPGQQATVDVTASGPPLIGVLNAWIDFWGDGDWDDPVDQIFTNVLLSGGGITDSLTFMVPASSAGNINTFARFRIDSAGGLSYTGQATDGEVEDYRVYIEHKRKWSQPPVEIDPGLFYGWDEMSIYGWMQIAGDDWLCEDQRPVSDIHWWGSYYEWSEPVPPQPAPIAFHIGIWTDVPLGDPCNMYPYSHPGRMIWEYWADIAEVNEEWVGFDFHEQHPIIDTCFKYDLQLPEEFWFWQEGPGNIYWLTISAMYIEPPPPQFYWGWKTREHFFNDDAVRIWMPTDPMVGVEFIEGEPILPGWDMAFELTTPCSNCGDFDDNGSIDLNDLRILAANWLWTGTPGGNIADLNCDGKIDYEDFAIFALQWLGSCP